MNSKKNIKFINQDLTEYFENPNDLCKLLGVDKISGLAEQPKRLLLEACEAAADLTNDKFEAGKSLMNNNIPDKDFDGLSPAEYIVQYEDGINLVINDMEEIVASLNSEVAELV